MARPGSGTRIRAALELLGRPFRKNDDLFRRFFEEAPIALACVSMGGRFEALNRRFTTEIGYSLAELPDVEAWWKAAYPDPDYRRSVSAAWQAAVEAAEATGAEVEAGEYRVRRRDGSDGYYLIGARIVEGRLLATLVDVSKLRQVEDESRRNEVRFMTLFEEAPLPLAIFTREGKALRYNRRFVSLLGYSMEDFGSTTSIWDRAYPDPAAKKEVEDRWREAARPGGRPFEAFESRLFTAGGEELVAIISTVTFQDGLLVSLLDITERKKAEMALAESLERYRALSETTASGIWQVTLDAMTAYANPALAKLLDVDSVEALEGRNCFDLFAPESVQKARAGFESRLRGISSSYEAVMLTSKGEKRFVLLSGAPMYGVDGKVTGTIASVVDITERKRAEAALNESLTLYRTLAETAPMGIWLIGADDLTIYANPAMRSFVGYGPDEDLAGLHYELFFAPECRERVRYEHGKRARGLYSTYEAAVIDRQERRRDVLVAGAPLLGDDGSVTGTIVSLVDITELKHAEALLRRGEERLRSLVSILQSKADSGQAFIEMALAEVLELTDSAYGYIYLYDEERREFTLNSWSHDVMPACRVADPQKAYALDSTGIWGEAVRQRKPIVVNDFSAANPLKKGYPAGHVELRRFMTVPVFSGDRVVAVVGAANKAEPYDEADVLQVSLLMDGVWKGLARREAEEALKSLNAELERKVEERTADLASANLELQVANVGLGHAMEELREAQDKVIVSEKLAALGRLMAGIAHELNTPLAAIAASARFEVKALGDGLDALALSASRLSAGELGLLARARSQVVVPARPVTAEPGSERLLRREAADSLAAAGVPDADCIAEDLVELGLAELAAELAPAFAGPRREDFLALLRGVIGSYRAARVSEDAVDKAVRVVSALRTYARSGEDEEVTRIRLAPEIRGLLDLYYNQTKRGIELVLGMDEGLEIAGRREALNRIWFNLLNNAIQACGGSGRVEISAHFEGKDLLVSIADSGPGIPESIRGRIFEPFFTTKPAGQGTGLGLDIARRLAREHGGDISFESSPGRTVFTVRLPQPDATNLPRREG